ncbi:MAG: VWA domain-containing protein, partial [Deltaproteobacteria bacterium]|nr:VWA domain-containing protein [Deltaproteobacteria bacterium]
MLIVSMPVMNGYAQTADDNTLSPYFFIENGDPSLDQFPLKETNVVVNINGVIADVVITQKYANSGSRPLNARYIFPASTRASVHGMKMVIGEEVINAEIKERQSAQNEFDAAQKQGKSASLLKQQRPNVFSMNVANIMPGDEIDIALHYTELLVPTDGTYEFVYPTVVGPRYSNQSEADAPKTDRWIKNPYLKQGSEPKMKFAIHLTVSTGIALQELVCPSHETETLWESDSVANIALAEPATYGGDRDFILNYRLAGQEIQSGLLLFEGKEENFFLLMVQPPERVQAEDIPPREYIFVLDVSGSMNGFPLNTAKKLLKNLIGHLKATDKFNVIIFAGGSRVLASSSVPATSENIRKAIQLVNKQRGGGGTELLPALRKGLSLPRDEAFSRTMIVVTDGYIGAEKDVFEEIQRNLNRTNVFAFGIGSSVNRYLIEGMAKAGQGEPFVVTEPQQAPGAAERFRRYVQSPVLTHVELEFSNFETYDVEPPAIPDLFADRPVIVFGKWSGLPHGTIELTGAGGNGDYSKIVHVSDTKPLEANRALRYLWARTRIARLSDFNFKRGNPENKDEITTLGLTYHLLTAYTSFIAVQEEVRNAESQSEDVNQPLPLPQHVSNLAVGGSVSSVPEPE